MLTSEIQTRAKLMFIAILIGGIISFAALSSLFIGRITDFEDASTMGAQTTSIFSRVNGYLIHCRDSRDGDECIEAARVRGVENLVLWLGNSQLHAINQWQKGEVNATPMLFRELKKDPNKLNLDLITFSQPNANLQEHYVLFDYLMHKLPIKILILPVVFDDTREDGLRNGIDIFVDETNVKDDLSRVEIGKSLLEDRKNQPRDSDTSGISNTLQEFIERSFNEWLEQHSDLWKARPEIRGWIFSEIYNIRNVVFGIKPTTKRKIIPIRYKKNLAAYEATLNLARENGIKVLVYIAPIRNDIDTPYLQDEYSKFKLDVQLLAEKYGANFSNLEGLIPSNLWGQKDSTGLSDKFGELDFMHFQAGGHKLLATKVNQLILDSYTNSGNSR